VACPEHRLRCTRDDITASVHYVHFGLDDDDVAATTEGPGSGPVSHENYQYGPRRAEISMAKLLADLPVREVLGRSAFMWFATPR
jgi:hypothetical protein